MKYFGVLFFVLLGTYAVQAQNVKAGGKAKASSRDTTGLFTQDFAIVDGDTVFIYHTLKSVSVRSLRKFDNPKLQKKYDKLVYQVKKVYPYAKRAGDVLKEEEAKMQGMGKGERKAHMKKVEKRIEDQFGGELRNLTFNQGRILLKLIDRETGHTSYALLDDLRGSFRAWFYDGIAGLFGYDLKTEYEPKKYLEDRYIEEIVRGIEAGEISLNVKK